MKYLVSFLVGLTFSLGLGVSGMTQPQKVVGFLDLFGAWDPTLAFVMVGAIAVHSIAYRVIQRQTSPLLDTQWHLPESSSISKELIVGAVLFGIGWGLAGYCPGPGLTAAASLSAKPLIFVGSMIGGMLLHKWYVAFSQRGCAK